MSGSTWISNLSVMDYVQNLYNQEGKNIKARSDAEVKKLTDTQSNYQDTVTSEQAIQGLLTTLQQNITALNNSFNATYQVASSDTTVATVQAIAGTTTSPGTHTLNVTQLAQAKSVASTTVFTSATNALNISDSDVLTVQVGSSSFNVPIQSTDSLNNIAKNINIGAAANNTGAIASVVQTGDNQYKLVISSTQTGVANEVKLTESQNDLGIDTQTAKSAPYAGTILTQAQNAHFTLDYVDGSNPGLSFDQATNTASVNGLMINLLSATAGAPGAGKSTTISVTANNSPSNVTAAAQKVVDSWNQIMNSITQYQAGASTYDSNLQTVQNTLSGIMRDNAFTLSKVGITATPYNLVKPITTVPSSDPTSPDFGKVPVQYYPTGLLTFDADKMTEALTDDFSSVQADLTSSTSMFPAVSKAIGDSSGAFSGTLQYALKQTITADNAQISSIKDQVSKMQADTTQQIKDLAQKYGLMALSMSKLQTTSQYLSQQIAVNTGKG